MQRSAARPAPVPSPLLTNFLIAILCLVWGSTWLVIKVGLEELPPLGSAGVRFIVAGVTMALVCTWLARREGGGRPPVSAVLAHGLCQFVLNYALVYASETVLPSGLVSVLWSIFPLAMAFTGHFVTRSEPLRAQQWIGFVVAFLGIVVLFVTDVARISARAIAMGLLLLLAPLSVTFSTTFVKTRAATASSLLLNRDSMLLGGVVLLALSWVVESQATFTWSPVALGSILYLALAGTVLTFGIYMWLLRHVPAYRMSLTAYVTPVVALLLGATIGGEPLRATTVAGTALVLGGVVLSLRRG
ncbi:MAG: EamA family transporter [Pseudomonadota bacterium]